MTRTITNPKDGQARHKAYISEVKQTHIRDLLTDEQQKVVQSCDRYIQVVAAAGSGKTHTVIEFIKKQLQLHELGKFRILLLSFSKKAVLELTERISSPYQEHVEISTFHSYCYQRIIKKKNISGGNFNLITPTKKIEFIEDFLRHRPHDVGGIPFSFFVENPAALLDFDPLLGRQLSEAFTAFKIQKQLFEYDDLVVEILKELENNTSFAHRLKAEFDLIVVDEFQDTNPLQLAFLKNLDPQRLLVVGDDYQAIYGFRGATVEPFLNFKKYFRGAKVYRLSRNFRSVRSIVSIGNKIIAKSSKQLKKRVISKKENIKKNHVYSVGVSDANRVNVVKMINKSQKDIMVIVRTNRQKSKWVKNGLPPDRVLTIHKSKGLEFQNVIVDLTDGWSSAMRGNVSQSKKDEEIRLHYVASSRAKELLLILCKMNISQECLENEYFKRLYKRGCKDVSLLDLVDIL